MNVHSVSEKQNRRNENMDKKQAVLEATLELIAEQGFHGTPMSQIAQKANIGVGTIYRYFSGKEELINELYIYIKRRMAEATMKDYSKDQPVADSIKEVLKQFVYYMYDHPAELSFHEQYSNSPLITQATRGEALRIAEPIEDLFQRARSGDLIKDLPDSILMTLLTGAVFSLVKLYITAGMPIRDESLTAETDAIWDMIKK
jgi:AcrR family transcriptional regulator